MINTLSDYSMGENIDSHSPTPTRKKKSQGNKMNLFNLEVIITLHKWSSFRWGGSSCMAERNSL